MGALSCIRLSDVVSEMFYLFIDIGYNRITKMAKFMSIYHYLYVCIFQIYNIIILPILFRRLHEIQS